MMILNEILKELGVVIEIVIPHTLKNIKHIFLAVLLKKLFVLMINLVNQLFFTEEKNVVYRFIETILKEYNCRKKVIKKHVNKNLIMSEKDEQILQSSNKSWISNNLFDVGDYKVRDHCYITGKHRGSAY